jgi:NAD(P)-dependent dehydrogenase (short-subunit alcohol dehydrogenase family)
MTKVSLKGKIAVVTGSTKGIGFAISKEFAENNGVTVIVCSRSIQKAEKAAQQINGKAFAAEIDITSNSSVKRFLQKVLSNYRRIDILINNAGYPFNSNIWSKKFHKVTDEELDKIIEVDLKGSVRLSKAVINHMLKNEIKGVIINISSTPAIVGHIQGAPYTLAKASLIALTKHIAMEYGSNNIRAYTLALGNIATEATFNSMSQEDRKMASEEASMKRWGKPEEVAKAAACIASCNFSFATGNTIVIDGGTVLL